MEYCERHKSFYPVCCQSCQWEKILGLDQIPAEAMEQKDQNYRQAAAEQERHRG